MNRARIAVLISGRGSNMAALLYAAKHPACPFEIVLVTGDNPQAAGLDLAEAEGVPVVRMPVPADKTSFFGMLDANIRNAGADYIALAGFMRILPPAFVARWPNRILNIHPSLLPHYKGLHTHQRALAAGDGSGGCSVHIVTEKLDDGAVLGQTEVAILPGDTAETLAARVLIAEHQLYPRVLADYVGRVFSPAWLTEQVRHRAMALPHAEETLSHGMACFGIVKGKKFAWVSNDHHGDGRVALFVKISGHDEQAQLIEADPERYCRPAYFGDDWIAMRLDLGDTDWSAITDWLQRSWLAIAPAKLKGLVDMAGEF